MCPPQNARAHTTMFMINRWEADFQREISVKTRAVLEPMMVSRGRSGRSTKNLRQVQGSARTKGGE